MTDHHNSCRCPYCEQQRNIVAQIAQPPLSPEQVFEESDKQLKKDTWIEALNWFEEQLEKHQDYAEDYGRIIDEVELRSQIEEKRKSV